MAQPRSHLTVSTFCALAYCGIGIVLWGIGIDLVLLAAILVVIGGMLPNVDSGPGSEPGKKLIGFVGALAPLIIISAFPEFRSASIARLALLVIISFFVAQHVSSWILGSFFTHRGLLHSIPAAIIIFEVGYLIFFDLPPSRRLYLGGAAFVGFASHLILDAMLNVDLVGNKEKKTPVLKLAGPSWQSTFALYSTLLVLGWFVLKDLSPGLKIYGGVNY
jgi:membrane-bound metal-dependent hydrolase YbcI (DUF457 family)